MGWVRGGRWCDEEVALILASLWVVGGGGSVGSRLGMAAARAAVVTRRVALGTCLLASDWVLCALMMRVVLWSQEDRGALVIVGGRSLVV